MHFFFNPFLSIAPQYKHWTMRLVELIINIINVIKISDIEMKVMVCMTWKNLQKIQIKWLKMHGSSGNINSTLICESGCCFSVYAKRHNIDLEPVNLTFPLCTGVHFCFVTHRMFDILSLPRCSLSRLIPLYYAAFIQSSVMKPDLSRYGGESSSDGTFMCTTCLFLWEKVVLGSFLCLWLWQLALDSDLAPFCLVNRCL